MAYISAFKDQLFVSVRGSTFVIRIEENRLTETKVLKSLSSESNQSPQVEGISNLEISKTENGDAKTEKSEKKKTKESSNGSTSQTLLQTLCTSLSPCRNYFGFSTNDKTVSVWNTSELESSPVVRNVVKQATAIAFHPKSETGTLFVADRAGDVYEFGEKPQVEETEAEIHEEKSSGGQSSSKIDPQENSEKSTNSEDNSNDAQVSKGNSDEKAESTVDPENQEKTEDSGKADKEESKAAALLRKNGGRLLLGHVSLLLDLKMTSDSNFIISSERDEKIRVTHFPDTFDIASFCLGHTSYVKSIDFLRNEEGQEFMISGSGDGSVKIWNHQNGSCVATYSQAIPAEKVVEVEETNDVSRKPIKKIAVSPLKIQFDDGMAQKFLVGTIQNNSAKFQFLSIRSTIFSEIKCLGELSLEDESSEIWDATFDSSGRFWVLGNTSISTDNSSRLLHCFKWSGETEKIEVVDFEFKPSPELIKAMSEAKDETPHLEKKAYHGNVEAYHNRKRARVEEGIGKKKPTSGKGKKRRQPPL